MKAIVYREYGPPSVLRVEERPDPQPGPGQVLVRVKAASVNYGDLAARRFGLMSPAEFNMPAPLWFVARLVFGWNRPRNPVLGNEYAGVIEALGPGVTAWKPGDAVLGYSGQAMGAYAQRLVVAADGPLVPKPERLSFEQAAVLPYGPVMALPLLRRAALKPGSRVLVLGASGSLGAAALQIARHQGATVDGVCGPARFEYVRSLGAERVFGYAQDAQLSQVGAYDLVFDVLGRSSLERYGPLLKPGGLLLLASFKGRHLLQALISKLTDGPRMVCAMAPGAKRDLEEARTLAEQGVFEPWVDRVFPMEEAAAAHAYAESAERRGPVAITFE